MSSRPISMFMHKMNPRCKYLLFLFLVSFMTMVHAQEKNVIRGRVVDDSDNTPIIGATIVEYDKDSRIINGTISNVDGDFVLEVGDLSHIITVSFIGYANKEIPADPSTNQVVRLFSSAQKIEEVSITAQSRSSSSLMNIADRDKASSSVKVDLIEMQETGVVSAADALQGKISGLDIISASGDPGSGSQLVIRGLSSMGNNQPLIVVDGIPQRRIDDNFDLTSADSEDIGNLINVAVQDIKSIEVLKDAASTAIYGSRGADGVLLIETHKGRVGKVEFNYQYKNSYDLQPPPMPMLNGDEYIMLQQEQWHNYWGTSRALPQEIAYDEDYVDFKNYSANTNWLDEITQNGVVNDHYFSISGGGDKTRYFTSLSYIDESGTTINTSDQKFSSRVNLDYFLSKKMLFQVKFNYLSNNTENNIVLSGRNIREMAYLKAPNMSIWAQDAEGNETGEYFTPIYSYQGDGLNYYNPVAVANLGRSDKRFNQLNNSFMLQYRISNWLTFRETISFQYQASESESFLPYNSIGTDWLAGQVNLAKENNRLHQSLRTETQMAFTSPFQSEIHELSGVFSWITDQSSSEFINLQSNKIPSTDLQDPATISQLAYMQTLTSEYRMARGAGNINYKLLDRYIIQAMLSADGFSGFGAERRWGVFPGLSLGWRFSEEAFFESLKFLGESMLRVSWGISGRQPGEVYARYATYGSTGSYINTPAVTPLKLSLDELRWEKMTSYNVGVELNLFKDRLYLEGELYFRNTTDILFDDYNIPLSSGFNSMRYFNGGEMSNKGWELMSDFRIIRNENWLWSVNFNISQNINAFNKLPENFNPELSTSIGNGQYPLRVQEGQPIGSFFGFRYQGVWPSNEDVVATDADGNILTDRNGVPIPLTYNETYTFTGGDPIYEDINHDGKIDLNDVVYLGDSNPIAIGGFGTNLKYKNFDFGMMFHYRLGFDIINIVALRTEGMNDRNNQSKATLHRWRVQGQDEPGMIPRAQMFHPAGNLGSDRYVEQGDFVRLNNVKLSYRINQNLCNKLRVKRMIFTFSVRKLYTFTRYSGQDPEIGQNAIDPFWIGVDEARTPPPKRFTLSISVGF